MEEKDKQDNREPATKTSDEKVVPEVKTEDESNELKYNMCKYCKGIIPRYSRKSTNLTYCAKHCSETNKMVPNDDYVYNETGDVDTKGKEWSYYKEVLREKAAPAASFTQKTYNVNGLEAGMKLEALDMNNPVNYCVATVIKVVGHRLCIRYDGFGSDASHDFWCNFQAEELYPIGWCAQHQYALQPPTGITSTLAEWKAFLTRTLTGALAAPLDLFRKLDMRRQLRCHPYLHGNKVEVIHPKRPDLIVPATITKSLGPYFFLVKTDSLCGVPTCVFYGYADCPGVYPVGWCESRGLELLVPSASSGSQELKMTRKPVSLVDITAHGQKRSRLNPYKISQKVEAVDGHNIRVATVAEVFGRVSMFIFDGTDRKKFCDKNSSEIFQIGWCERTGCVLSSPYGQVQFGAPNPGGSLKVNNSGGEVVNSASFISFQKSMQPVISPVKSVYLQAEDKSNLPQMLTPTASSTTTTQEQDADCVVETLGGDIDLDLPLSPRSPTSGEKQKCDMEHFIVWLMNSYAYDNSNEIAEYIIKPDLVDHFINSTNIRLSPRWFSLIYKLFPGVSTVRKSIDGKFVNCFKNLKEIRHDITSLSLYVKNAVDLLRGEGIPVIVAEDKLVAYMGIGDKYTLPEDTQELFTYGRAKENSKVLVISGEVCSDFRVTNFLFTFENNTCLPPLQKLSTIEEFSALIKLCKQARPCIGIPIIPKADNTTPNYRHGKYVKNGRLYSSNCNVVAYAHKSFVCLNCKSIRTHSRPNPGFASSTPATPNQENDAAEGLEKDELDESTPSKEEEDNLPSPDIKIYFNTACYPGIYLDPVKVSQMVSSTQLDRPAQTLKYLVERLIEVSLNKERLLEIIEAGFGTRIFNKTKDKVVKKGLFRFNTRRKVIRFLKRLAKRLNCCEFFLNIDPKECSSECKKTSKNDLLPMVKIIAGHHCGGEIENTLKNLSSAVMTDIEPSTKYAKSKREDPSQVALNATHTLSSQSLPPSQQNAAITGSKQMQVLYQLPMASAPTSNTTTMLTPGGTPRIMVQTPDGMNMRTRFPHVAQYFVPSRTNNVAYMVVTKEDIMSNTPVTVISDIHSSSNHSQMLSVSSPPTGVTQMMANIAKTNLVTDIDDPSKVNQMSQISVVKGAGTSNQQILIKKTNFNLDYKDQYSHEMQRHTVRSNTNFPANNLQGNTPINNNPPSYQDATNNYHYPRVQAVSSYGGDRVQTVNTYGGDSRSQHDQSRTPLQSVDKSQQIHVHKVHHGNARVKYVEFKPMQDGRVYNQNMNYHHNNQHLSVHTTGHAPKSPLHSPPALRPPPSIPTRPIALSSPPSLVPSPDVRPRFDFVSSQPPTSPNVHSPVQVANVVSHGKFMQGKHIGNQNITLPRLPSSYQLSPLAQQNNNQMLPRGNVTAFHTVRVPTMDGSNKQDIRMMAGSSGSTGSSSMTYIPIQTSTKDKFVYVPVNSLQSHQGQPVVLYQNNQQLKDVHGKPMFIPQQQQLQQQQQQQYHHQQQQHTAHKANNMADTAMSDNSQDQSAHAFTTVRIQGMQQGMSPSTPTSAQHMPMKTFKYQFGANMASVTGNQRSPQSPSFNQNNEINRPGHGGGHVVSSHDIKNEHIMNSGSTENQGEIMTLINNQLRMVPPQVGIQSDTNTSGAGTKRDGNRNQVGVQSAVVDSSPVVTEDGENYEGVKAKKRRGRPPASKLQKQDISARSKLSMMQVNPLAASATGNPITLANRVLTETYYKKQQQLQNRANFLNDPLLKLPDLPSNPESWSPDDVHKFLSETDCASYANLLKDEEIDGKSFLLMTREALMEFMGMRLGPALKISGHAAFLRARHRMQNMPLNGQSNLLESSPQVVKERKPRIKKEHKIKEEAKNNLKSIETHVSVPASVSECTNDKPVNDIDNSLEISAPFQAQRREDGEKIKTETTIIDELDVSAGVPIALQNNTNRDEKVISNRQISDETVKCENLSPSETASCGNQESAKITSDGTQLIDKVTSYENQVPDKIVCSENQLPDKTCSDNELQKPFVKQMDLTETIHNGILSNSVVIN